MIIRRYSTFSNIMITSYLPLALLQFLNDKNHINLTNEYNLVFGNRSAHNTNCVYSMVRDGHLLTECPHIYYLNSFPIICPST